MYCEEAPQVGWTNGNKKETLQCLEIKSEKQEKKGGVVGGLLCPLYLGNCESDRKGEGGGRR